MLILGIESSCDETAAAIVRDGREILSSVISSQIDLHKQFGGVVPELASREHLVKIEPVVREAFDNAGISPAEIDAIAVTQGPGLIGSLLVGVSFAKALALSLNIPIIGVNHIEGHFYSVVFDNPLIEYPAIALIVSGGHSNLFFAPEAGKYKVIARTRDDAAGEAFDKVSKMLGLGYPGGPVIERSAKSGDANSIKFPLPKISDGKPDFSFSGLKTAVSRYIREHEIEQYVGDGAPSETICNIAASFQKAAIRTLLRNIEKLSEELLPKTFIVSGGVACNQYLREEAEKISEKIGIPVFFPSKHLSTDNAAMIAAAGHFRLQKGEVSDLKMTADTTIRLQNYDLDEAKLRAQKVRHKL